MLRSALVVEKGAEVKGVGEWLEVRGGGWGEGVGVCEMGGGVMGEKGYW